MKSLHPMKYRAKHLNLSSKLLCFALAFALFMQPLGAPIVFASSEEAGHQSGNKISSTQPLNTSDAPSPVDIVKNLAASVQQGTSGTPVELAPEAKNTFYLLSQNLIDHKTGEKLSLSEFDLSKKEINVPPGVLESKLRVDIKNKGRSLVLSYNKHYSHEIVLNKSEKVLDAICTNEYVYVLLSSGKVLAADVSSLRYFLFKSSVPFFAVTKVKSVAPKSKLTVIQRRVQPLAPSEAKFALNKNPNLIERQVATSSRKDIAALESNFQKLEYIPLTKTLGPERPNFKAGDVGVVRVLATGAKNIYSVIPKAHMSAEVASQTSVFQAMLALTNPDANGALKEIQATSKEAQKTVQEFLQDPQKVQRFYQGGMAEALLSVPSEGVAKVISQAQTVVESEADITARDSFTESEWRADSKFFEETIQKAKDMRNASVAPDYVRKMLFLNKKRWEALHSPRSIRRLTTVMACAGGACVAGVGALAWNDTTPAEIIASKHAVNFISGSMYWLTEKFPVLADAEYRKILSLSVLSQACIPVIVFTAAGVASLFSTYKISQIPAMAGIRLFARIFQVSPFRMLASLTNQRIAFKSFKRGQLVGPSLPMYGWESKVAQSKSNAQVKQKFMIHSFATSYALAVASVRTGVDAGEIYLTSKGDFDYTNKDHQKVALAISDQVKTELLKVHGKKVAVLVDKHSGELVRDLNKYYLIGDKLSGDADFKKTWVQSTKDYLRFKVAPDVISTIANYSEKTFFDLSNAVPDKFTSSMVNRGYVIDYSISLGTASVAGDFANIAKPEMLHAQAGKFAWSSPIVTAENVHQTIAHLGKSASGTYEVFSKELGAVNTLHRPAESVDEIHKEVQKKMPLWKESLSYLQTMAFDYRNTGMGEILGQKVYASRVKLFQSTLLSGLAVRVFMVGQPAEQAVLGQVLFMGCAMWAYAWPWVPYMTTQELHEKRMESKYSRQEKIRLRLSIAARTKDVELAEKSAAQLRELYSQADLKHAEVPTQKQGVSSTEYAKTLYDYSMKNPAFPKRHSELIASSMLGVVAVTTTVMATYLFTETFSGKLKLGGFNWADWNLTHVPKGDGVVSIAIKSAILTAVFWEGQRLFNWAWDELQLKRRGLSEEKRKELTERRDKAKKLALDFGPTRVAIKLGERPAKLAATAVGVPAKYVASKVEKPVKRAFEVVAEPTNRVIEAVKEPAKRMTGAIAEPTKRAFNAVAEPTKKAITAVKEPVKKIYEAVKKPVKQGYEVAVKQPVEFGYKAAERPIKGLLKAGEKSVELAITGSGKVYNAGEKSVKVAKKAGGVAIGSCRSIFQRFSGK